MKHKFFRSNKTKARSSKTLAFVFHKGVPVILLVLFTSSFLSTIFSPVASAAIKYSDLNVIEKAVAYEDARLLRACILDSNYGVETNESFIKQGRVTYKSSAGDLTLSSWNPTIVNAHASLKDDNQITCSEYDMAIVKGAVKRLKIDPIKFVCDLGAKRESGASNCEKGSGNFTRIDRPSSSQIDNAIRDQTGVNLLNPGGAALYLYNLYPLYDKNTKGGCIGSPLTRAEWEKEGGNTRYNIPKYPNDAANEATDYYGAKSTKNKKPLNVKGEETGSTECRTYWENVLQYYGAYKAEVDLLPPSERDDIQGGIDNPTPADEALPTTCVVNGIGWIVCPVTQFIASISDALYGWITSALVVQPLNTDTSDGANTTYIAWTTMRNIANIAFVIAFIIIIYSQLTGAGVSNYGVKKLLPRLVIAAILVNVSYWVSAIAVDLSNIVGNNLYNYLRGVSDSLGQIDIATSGWEMFAGVLLSGVGATAAGFSIAGVAAAGSLGALGMAGVYAFLVFLLSVVLALIIAFVILAARQAFIIILIVISPLAFVAMLLPNTEKYFSLWRKSLTTMLVFYPLFSLLFGGSALAGMIIIGSAGQANANDPTTGMMLLIGLTVTALPLWLTPLIMKFSTGVLGQVAGMVNNRSKGLIDRARNVRNRKAGLAMHETLGHANNARNPFGRLYRRFNNSAQADADRKKIIDTRNQSVFEQTDQGETLNLTKKAASDQLAVTTAATDALYEEMKAGKASVPLDRKGISFDAQRANGELDIQKDRLRSAQSVLQQQYAQTLASDPGAAKRAAGIDQRGQSRVIASAQATLNKAESDAIAAEKVTMSQMGAGELSAIMQDASASIERRSAAAGQLARVGGDEDIYKALDYVGGLAASAETTAIQQQLAADIGSRKPYSIGAMDFANLGQGKYSGAFTEKVVSRIQGGKLSADTVINGGADELKQIIAAADGGHISRSDATYAQLKSQIDTYLTTPTNKQPPQEILDLIQKL